jgi:hypothetical protein
MSWETKSYWEVLAGVSAVIVLFISVCTEVIAPLWRKRKLKYPCEAYFSIWEEAHGDLPYVVQDDAGHRVKELVLPSYSEVVVEVTYSPRIPFNVVETVFGCEGDADEKPLPQKRIRSFLVKGGDEQLSPGIDKTETIDRKGNYHMRATYAPRSYGSWYVMAFVINTRKPGVYKTFLGFITDQMDATANPLVMRVEDTPRTRMRCSLHWHCYIKPQGRPK